MGEDVEVCGWERILAEVDDTGRVDRTVALPPGQPKRKPNKRAATDACHKRDSTRVRLDINHLYSAGYDIDEINYIQRKFSHRTRCAQVSTEAAGFRDVNSHSCHTTTYVSVKISPFASGSGPRFTTHASQV